VTGDAKGALVAAIAFAVMAWLNRRPKSWWEGRPRPDQPPPERPIQGPAQGWVLERRPPGRKLEPWDGGDHDR
jgi:hypothetical protein